MVWRTQEGAFDSPPEWWMPREARLELARLIEEEEAAESEGAPEDAL
jgi:hypothetical protein